MFLAVTTLGPAARGTDIVAITDVPVPSGSWPHPIAADPGGGAWFAMPGDHRIGRVRPNGVVEEFSIPAPYEEPRGIAVGPDGGIWFTQTGGYAGSEGIGRIDGSGTFEEHRLPDGTQPYGIATGPDGNLWFTALGPGTIGRITTDGTVTMLPGGLAADPLNITSGPDGAIWFTEDGVVQGSVGAIGRVTTAGDISEFELPTPAGASSGAGDIAVGPDGSLWFTWVVLPPGGSVGSEQLSIGRITPAGDIKAFPIAASGGWPPGGIARGVDGALWFTAFHANAIGRISTQGTVTTYAIPTSASGPYDIAAGPDGTLWFTEAGASRIGRVALVQPPAVPTAPAISSFSPGSGPSGTAVAIAGSNLASTTGVWFNGTFQSSYAVDPTGTLISTTVPAGATSGPIVIATAGGMAATPTAFVVTPEPMEHTRTVTLHLEAHLHARGIIRVGDGSTACLAHRYVTIQRHVHGRWRIVGGDLTDRGGRYALTIPDRAGWYRAAVREIALANGDSCAAAVSRTRLHAA